VGGIGFEPRTSCLLYGPSPTWTTLLTLFASVIFQVESMFLSRLAWTAILLLIASGRAGGSQICTTMSGLLIKMKFC
jgi:hypothetical protein